jgi:hypothetical protein
MLLSALLLASAVQAGPTMAPPSGLVVLRDRMASGQATFYRSKADAIAAYEAMKACRAQGLEYAEQPAAPPAVKALGDLPPANRTLTVLRSVEGCPVSSTVRYNVDLPPRR